MPVDETDNLSAETPNLVCYIVVLSVVQMKTKNKQILCFTVTFRSLKLEHAPRYHAFCSNPDFETMQTARSKGRFGQNCRTGLRKQFRRVTGLCKFQTRNYVIGLISADAFTSLSCHALWFDETTTYYAHVREAANAVCSKTNVLIPAYLSLETRTSSYMRDVSCDHSYICC